MKTKNIWTLEDLTIGMYIIKESSPKGSKNIAFARSVTFKIGFDNSNKLKPYGRISCLNDGWYQPIGNKQDVVDFLNNDEHGYRGLTKEEYINMVSDTWQGFDDNPSKSFHLNMLP